MDKSDIFDVSVFLVTRDGDIVCLEEIDSEIIPIIDFIMLTNDVLNPEYGENNSICIHKDLREQLKCPGLDQGLFVKNYYNNHICNILTDDGFAELIWQSDNLEIPRSRYMSPEDMDNYKIDFNGYKNTNDIISKAELMLKRHNDISDDGGTLRQRQDNIVSMFPALFGTYKNIVTYKGRYIHGYLPALGQLLCISKNVNAINRLLYLIEKTITFDYVLPESDKHLESSWWSSTQKNKWGIWLLSNGDADFVYKCFSYRVLTLFKIE